jgi:hypothetical protein
MALAVVRESCLEYLLLLTPGYHLSVCFHCAALATFLGQLSCLTECCFSGNDALQVPVEVKQALMTALPECEFDFGDEAPICRLGSPISSTAPKDQWG